MPDVTLAVALDALASHLDTNTSAAYSSRMTLSQATSENKSPYIGVVNSAEDVLVRDAYTDRLSVSVLLYVVVKEQDLGLEEFKQEVKTALRTASLGDNIHGIEYEGSQVSVIEDFNQPDADKYSGVIMEVTILFMDNFGTVPDLAAGPLLEPVGFSHYKVFALLTSGSIATNTYHYHDVADLQLDAISVGVETSQDSEDARSVTSIREEIINHETILSIRYHNSYDPGPMDHTIVRQRMDQIVTVIKANFNLGNNYKLLEFSSIVYDTAFSESETRGGQINVRVDKLLRHTQD